MAISIAGAFAAAYGVRELADVADLVNAAIVNGHSRSLENQSDRVGLQYLVTAGYDPREAPSVWKLMTKKFGLRATNFFWSSHENHATRRSYLMNELKNNYRDLDYSSLTKNEGEFRRMKEAVAVAKDAKKKIKIVP